MTKQQKMWYAMGVLIGTDFKGQGEATIDSESLLAGMTDVYAGNEKIVAEEAAQIVGDYRAQKMSVVGTAWLAENAKKEGVQSLPSGLQYKVLSKGDGAKKPVAADTVSTHYEGSLINGQVFDSSYKREEPVAFPLNRVIAGWTEGIQLMTLGDTFEFYIPFNLGYGAQGAGNDIPPYATLIFKVELLGIE